MNAQKKIISLLLITFLFVNIFTTVQAATNPQNDIWTDGSFQGTITEEGSTSQLLGRINFARTPQSGRLFFTYQTDNQHFLTHAWYFNGRLIGFQTEPQLKLVTGTINVQPTLLTIQLAKPQANIETNLTASYLPPVTGPYSIGVQSYHLIDESREELLTQDTSDVREFMIKIWYPTTQDAEGDPYIYMPQVMFDWLIGRAPIPLPLVSETAYLDIQPHAKTAVPLADDQTEFPVVIFSHGYDGTLEIYSSFIEELVTQGFIVAAINHPYLAGVVEFPDGRAVYCQNINNPDDPNYYENALRTIIDDAKYTIDYLETLNDSSELFTGKLNLDSIGMYGHSFGGACTSITCYEDERVDCGLTLDGVVVSDLLTNGIDKPFFMMTADGRLNSTGNTFLWDEQDSDIYKMSIHGSAHYGYTDVGLLLSHMMPNIPQKLLGFGTIDAKLMTQIVRSFVVEFFDCYLKGEAQQDIINLADYYQEHLEFLYK